MIDARTIVWLSVGVVAVTLANLCVEFGAPAAKRLPRARLADVSFSPTKITVERAGVQNVELELKGRWRLISPYPASSDEHRVLRLVDALSFSVPDDTITEAELLRLGRERADFGLDSPRLRIKLENPSSGAAPVTVSFGESTPAADGVYALSDTSDTICVVPMSVFTAVDLTDAEFRSHEVFSIEEESVFSFSVKLPGKAPVDFTRSADGWKTPDGPASTVKVKEYLAKMFEAEAKSFVWPVGASNEATSVSAALLSGYGLDPDSALTVVTRGFDGENRRVSFGAAVDDSSVYALIQNGGAVVTVPSSIRDAVSQPPVRTAESRAFPFEESAVSAFTLSTPAVTCVLARGKEGAWSLESPIVAPADAKIADALLARILALPVSTGVAPSDAVSISIGTNSSPVEVSVSKLFSSMRFEDLRSKEVVRIDSAVVTRLVSSVSGKDAVAAVYSSEKKMWVPEEDSASDVINDESIKKILGALNPLQAVRVETLKAAPADLARYGLDAPRLVLAVDRGVAGSVRRNILIGKETRGGYYATVGSADAIFVVSRESVQALMSPLLKNKP